MKLIVKKYLECFENFNLKSINKILKYVDKKIIFVDPFNKIKGRNDLKNLLISFLNKFNNPKFNIINVTNDGSSYFVKWKLEIKYKKKIIMFFGMSELIVKNNLIISHIDYWDSGKNFYCNIPILGWLFKQIHK